MLFKGTLFVAFGKQKTSRARFRLKKDGKWQVMVAEPHPAKQTPIKTSQYFIVKKILCLMIIKSEEETHQDMGARLLY
jgi:ribosomal protein S9